MLLEGVVEGEQAGEVSRVRDEGGPDCMVFMVSPVIGL